MTDRPADRVISTYGQGTYDTLRDVLDFADLASQLVARGRTSYDADVTVRLAGEAICHRMGDAVARLPREFTESHPEIQFSAIKGMRDIIAHQYGEVDYRILWNALFREFPVDATRIAQILDL